MFKYKTFENADQIVVSSHFSNANEQTQIDLIVRFSVKFRVVYETVFLSQV